MGATGWVILVLLGVGGLHYLITGRLGMLLAGMFLALIGALFEWEGARLRSKRAEEDLEIKRRQEEARLARGED